VKLCLLCAVLLPICSEAADISAARCRKTFLQTAHSSYVGQVNWQDQADGSIAGSTETKAVGKAELKCTVKFARPVDSTILDFGGAHISYAGAPSKEPGSGLTVEVFAAGEQVCRITALRITGEDWAELSPAIHLLRFSRPRRTATVVLRIVDVSDRDTVRVDVKAIKLRVQ
jgi:hypothetical protein